MIKKVVVYSFGTGEAIPGLLKFSSSAVGRSAHLVLGRPTHEADRKALSSGGFISPDEKSAGKPGLALKCHCVPGFGAGEPIIVGPSQRTPGGYGLIDPYPTHDLGVGLFGEGISKREILSDPDLLAHLGLTAEEVEAAPTRRGAWA